jgi:hypothetical protein
MAKVLISIEDGLLRQVDHASRSQGLSRSGYLAELARRELREGPGGARGAGLTRIDRLFDEEAAEDSTDVIRSERDAR